MSDNSMKPSIEEDSSNNSLTPNCTECISLSQLKILKKDERSNEKEMCRTCSETWPLMSETNLRRKIASLPKSTREEIAKRKWDSMKSLSEFVDTYIQNNKQLNKFSPKERVQLAKTFTEKGYTKKKITSFLGKQIKTRQARKKVRELEIKAGDEIEDAGEVPINMMISRTLTLGPMLDYMWTALDTIAKQMGFDSTEDYISVAFLKSQAVDYYRILTELKLQRMNELVQTPKAKLKELKKKRGILRGQLTKVEKKIDELEREVAHRRRV